MGFVLKISKFNGRVLRRIFRFFFPATYFNRKNLDRWAQSLGFPNYPLFHIFFILYVYVPFIAIISMGAGLWALKFMETEIIVGPFIFLFTVNISVILRMWSKGTIDSAVKKIDEELDFIFSQNQKLFVDLKFNLNTGLKNFLENFLFDVFSQKILEKIGQTYFLNFLGNVTRNRLAMVSDLHSFFLLEKNLLGAGIFFSKNTFHGIVLKIFSSNGLDLKNFKNHFDFMEKIDFNFDYQGIISENQFNCPWIIIGSHWIELPNKLSLNR